jgi:hypothetical protein
VHYANYIDESAPALLKASDTTADAVPSEADVAAASGARTQSVRFVVGDIAVIGHTL